MSRKFKVNVSVRTQLASLSTGDEKRYQSVLEHAYGGRIIDEENIHLMQGIRKQARSSLKEPSRRKTTRGTSNAEGVDLDGRGLVVHLEIRQPTMTEVIE